MNLKMEMTSNMKMSAKKTSPKMNSSPKMKTASKNENTLINMLSPLPLKFCHAAIKKVVVQEVSSYVNLT